MIVDIILGMCIVNMIYCVLVLIMNQRVYKVRRRWINTAFKMAIKRGMYSDVIQRELYKALGEYFHTVMNPLNWFKSAEYFLILDGSKEWMKDEVFLEELFDTFENTTHKE